MRVIGYRENTACFKHILLFVMAAIFIAYEVLAFVKFDTLTVLAFIVGMVAIIYCIYSFINFLKTPKEAIKLIEGKTLVFPNNIEVNIKNIADVSYSNAVLRRGIILKWGSVAVLMRDGNCYKVNYISQCQAVANEIENLIKK